MDGHALELEDGAFDISGSQSGVMLFPDLPRALRELVRVTRPGGRVFLVVYAPPPEVETMIAGLSERQRAEAVRRLDDALRERSGGKSPAGLTAGVHFGIGRKR